MTTALPFPPVRGVVFDLDGTVVDSALDFDLMRREMAIADGHPVLEALARMHVDDALRCQAILDRHERAGAERAVLLPGVAEFLNWLHRRGIPTAVWTRNGRAATDATLRRLNLSFERVVTREDAPAKPDPTAIWGICEAWNVDRREMLMIGDYVFDLEAARRAGIRGVLFTNDAEPHACAGHELADFHLRSFLRVQELIAWMGFGI
jgi:HAD superfamily hydrolase (TIGR01549 family)